jgi:hypothetical protein
MPAQALLGIAWPAFLAACALELLVFAFVDPADLHLARAPLAMSNTAVYTSAFFAFWIVAAAACTLAALLRLSPGQVNACPFDASRRPQGCPGVE